MIDSPKISSLHKEYWSESEQIINSWESIQDYEFKSQTEYLIAQNTVYTRIAKGNLEQIDAVIKMISRELEK